MSRTCSLQRYERDGTREVNRFNAPPTPRALGFAGQFTRPFELLLRTDGSFNRPRCMMLTDKLNKFLLNIFENECDHTVDSVFLAASDVDLPAWVLEFSKKYLCACQLWSRKHDFLLSVLAEAHKYCTGKERESIDALERAVRLTAPKA